MTLFAGIYSRRAGDVVPDALCDALLRALSRHPDEVFERYREDRVFLIKVDIGAYGDRATQTDADLVSFMVGEPLLARVGSVARARSADLAELHDAWRGATRAPLTRARGVFAAVHYDRRSAALSLLTDKLGIRPVYYVIGERFVIFANALRILEQLPEVPRVMDVRAVTEISALGFPLGARTPYASISLLAPAEILEVRGDSVSREQYWRWDATPVSDRPVPELAREAHQHFSDAVALRNRGDSTTVAFLSGGLDSRSIVMALRQSGADVHTFNMSPPGTQDAIFGAEFARKVGAMHTQVGMVSSQPQWASMMADAWSASPGRSSQPAERPSVVWSGDGGSVGLGHVYLTQAMVDLARDGDLAGAAQVLGRAWGDIPRRLLRRESLEALREIVPEGWLEELAPLRCADGGRCVHIAVMQNDQRRHLANFFETIDLHRLEYHLPFFDSVFLSSVLKVPIDACLGHGFYMQWLQHFPDVVVSVPWQAYPGHVPCPLPLPSGLRYQWAEAQLRDLRETRRQELLRATSTILGAPDFPAPLLKRWFLRVAAWTYRLRLRDLAYLMQSALLYHRYWSQCDGKYVLLRPPATSHIDRSAGAQEITRAK